jgi:hypothetical protein
MEFLIDSLVEKRVDLPATSRPVCFVRMADLYESPNTGARGTDDRATCLTT